MTAFTQSDFNQIGVHRDLGYNFYFISLMPNANN